MRMILLTISHRGGRSFLRRAEAVIGAELSVERNPKAPTGKATLGNSMCSASVIA